ncbi:MAG: transposase [Candidatus Coatesbacteria bacterium]|nr:MAG: transposase [Candidatus Coatesbacteria bacterium]
MFITTSFNGRKKLLRNKKYYYVLITSLEHLKKEYGFEIWAYVLMPSHIHLILAFPNENRLSAVLRDFKKFTAYKLRKLMEADGNCKALEELRNPNGRTGVFRIWEPRFDDVAIYKPEALKTKIDYIHTNPVRAGLCSNPDQWPYSSARDHTGGSSALTVDSFSFS